MKHFLLVLSLIIASVGIAQTPNNCGNYTSTGTNSSPYLPGTNTGCNSNVPGTVSGTGAWTGSGCTGTIVSTVTSGPVSCLSISYTAVNTNDYANLSTDTGGTLTITGVNVGVSGTQIGPYQCVGGGGSYGDVLVTICSTIPFNSVTLTNTGCTSGWVVNCATIPCDPSWTPPTPCSDDPPIDLSTTITGETGGTWSGTGISGTMFDPSVGTQSITYTAPCGDASTQTITVTPVGDPSWTPPTGICQNGPLIDLSTLVTGTAGGTWSGTGVSGNMFDPSSGTQTITYTAGTAPCDASLAQDINVTPAPDPSWTSPGTICEAAGTIDLNMLITGDAGGTWSGTGVTGNIFDPAGLSGPIAVTYTIGSVPCVGTDQQDITVVPDVDPSWTPPTTLCDLSGPFDLNTTITGTAGGTWSGTGVTSNTFDPSVGTQTITYTVGTAPCIESLALTINVGVTPDPGWTTFTMCASDAPIDMNNSVTGTTGGSWTGTGLSGSVFDPFFGSQDLTYTVTNGNCVSASTQTVSVVDPQLTTSSVNVTCNGGNDGSMAVSVTGGSGSYNYSWNTAPPQSTATASNIPAGTYTITVTDGSCVVTQDVTIIEPDTITATISAVNACKPELGSAQVIATGGVGGYSYSWNTTTETTPLVSNLDSAWHTVTITDANGCQYTDSVLIQTFFPPTVTVTSDTTIEYGDTIVLNAGGAVSYEWQPDTDLDCSTCSNPVAGPLSDTYYCVTGTDTNGCTNEACMLLSVIIVCGDVFVPSAFSPNDDGENDFLCVYSDCMEAMTFNVYNRWGEKVYTTNEMEICWDGTWNGKKLNSAVFVYTLDGYLINGEAVEQKGNISLIR